MSVAAYPFGSVLSGECDCPSCRLRDWHQRSVPPGALGDVIEYLAVEVEGLLGSKPTIRLELESWTTTRLRWNAEIDQFFGDGGTPWEALAEAFHAAQRWARRQ